MNRILSVLLLSAAIWCSPMAQAGSGHGHNDHHDKAEEVEKGPNRGRMLREGDFALELAIFETGVPPEFRVWATKQGKAVLPEKVDLNIKLTRLGDIVDDINFRAEGGYLRGDMEIYEPHSFVVTIEASHQGKDYRWQYDNFEGRTQIADEVAKSMEIKTEIAGAATLHETIKAHGRLVMPSEAKFDVSARFEGEVKQVYVRMGESVRKGQKLLSVESNQSFKPYDVLSPTNGVVTQQWVNAGEQTQGRKLLSIVRTDLLQAEITVFPGDYGKIAVDTPVELSFMGIEHTVKAKLQGRRPHLRADQARIYWLDVDNSEGLLSEGMFVTGLLEVATYQVPLAVKRSGLQGFRDFTVVYAKVGDTYEVRMLELGRQAGPWVEVLGGLDVGTEYVTDNSFIIKADIEKSGASHDH